MSEQPITDAADALTEMRASVGKAILDLQAFSGTAGSDEMRSVQCAIEYLGYAYSILSAPRDENPAWS